MEMKLHPEQVFLCCAVLYLDFLLPGIITGMLSSPDERTGDAVEDTRMNKAQWHTLLTDKANRRHLLSLLISSEITNQEDCVLCWVPDVAVCM